MTATEPFLDVEVLDKRFHRKTILKDVRLRLASGEVVALVGASGCGKSTLLRIVAGLDNHYRGRVALDGEPHCRPTRDVGFIFQEPRLFPWLTVAENVAFELGRGGEVAHAHPRVGQLLAEVGLSGLGRALPKELSGGQAQRVAIARGLFREPRLLLLDEPFSAVDAFTRIHLQKLLIDIAQRHGITVLLVTHDIDEALFLSHRVLVLEATPGGLVADVPVPLAQPRDRGDAAFVPLKRRLLDVLEASHAL